MSHVLIIEDDPDIVAVLAHHLRRVGHEVSVAWDGGEGYLSAIRERPDAIVLDLLLPGFTGHQVLNLLRTNPDVRKVPVLVLSALADAEQSDVRHRADAYLAKPFQVEPLVRRVEQLLATRRAG